MANSALFFVAFAFWFAALLQLRQLCDHLKISAALACSIFGGFLLYLAALLPGMIEEYTYVSVGISLIILSAISIGFFWSHKIKPVFPAFQIDATSLVQGPWNPVTIVVSLCASVCLTPLIIYIADLPIALFSPSRPFHWDIVSYHLPALIEFIQAHSLWSLNDPYQSFSYAFELIYGVSILFFKTNWGLILGNAYSVFFFFTALACMVQRGVSLENIATTKPINPTVVQLIAAGLWCLVLGNNLVLVGKNDIFMSACVLATFVLLSELDPQLPVPEIS